MDNYIKIGTLEDFSHKNYKTIRYLSKTIGVIKQSSGDFYAIEADCKHQKANLLVKGFKGDIVVCPRHGWKYNIRTGECLTESWACLRRYPLKVEEGVIYVCPTPVDSPYEDD